MLSSVTWRAWAATAVAAAAYLTAGVLSSTAWGTFEAWMYRVGLAGGTVTPLLLIGAYTAQRNAWWRNDVGSALVVCAACISVICAPLAWTFWVDGGRLTPSVWAWIAVSGPAAVTVAMLRLAVVFTRIMRHQATRPPGNP